LRGPWPMLFISIAEYNNIQLLKLHNDEEKGKRIFKEKCLDFTMVSCPNG